jgi:hypothetical protein
LHLTPGGTGASQFPATERTTMYIGGGVLGTILVILLIVWLIRRV